MRIGVTQRVEYVTQYAEARDCLDQRWPSLIDKLNMTIVPIPNTLKKIEEKLPDSLFLKVHRSYLINVKKIIDIEDNSVLIKKDLVPVSRSKRKELMKRLDLL